MMAGVQYILYYKIKGMLKIKGGRKLDVKKETLEDGESTRWSKRL
jgi:hypothetical protein